MNLTQTKLIGHKLNGKSASHQLTNSFAGSQASQDQNKACIGGSSEIDAFLYGLPGGFLIAGLILVCFIMFGNALSNRGQRRDVASLSSNTRVDKKYMIGKKHKRGPPPSQELKRLDVSQLAASEDAPEDIKAINAAKMTTRRSGRLVN